MNRLAANWIVALLLLMNSPRVPAQVVPSDDLVRCLPENTIAFLNVSSPRNVVEQLVRHFRDLGFLELEEVREVLMSTSTQRFFDYLQYLEKTQGRKWPQMLDDAAGRGIVLALVPGNKPEKPNVLLLIQARDPSLLRSLFTHAKEFAQSQAEQADRPVQVTETALDQGVFYSLGKDFHAACQNTLCVISSDEALLKSTLKQPSVSPVASVLANARFVATERPQGKNVMGWGWVDLVPIKKQAGADLDKIRLPTNDINPQLLIGGLLDAFLRSDHFWLAWQDDGSGPRLSITSPAGRSVSHVGSRALHMRNPECENLLPLLHPPGTLYSGSFYWDLGALWNLRDKLFTAGALKDFEDVNKKIKPFLAGVSLGDLLKQIGARHRIVVARQQERGYTSRAKTQYPAFALILECRDAEAFAKTVAIPLRAAGFFASTQFSVKMVEQVRGNCKILSYRFEENERNRKYEQGALFNFTPAFARCGNVVIFSSTLQLCQDLVDELQRPSTTQGEPADALHQFYWSALGEALAAERHLLATELTLRHGGSADQVEKHIQQLLQLLNRLGMLEVRVNHSPQFQLELRARYQ